MTTKGRINKLEQRAKEIIPATIFICQVEGDTITHKGRDYTRQEWEAWSAVNVRKTDTIIRVSRIEKRSIQNELYCEEKNDG